MVVEVVCMGVACVGRRGEWKGVLRDTRSDRDGGTDVSGAPVDSFKAGYVLRR